MHALVVQSQPTNAKYLETLLNYYGEVDRAQNGKDAWELYLQAAEAGSRYDIAFLDYALPLVDGLTLQRMIRDDEAKNQVPAALRTKLVLTTSYPNNRLILEGCAAGTDLFLSKPFSISQVQGFLKESGFHLPTATRY
ncbi:MAG: response regulator [bacterium]|nr:response regulator [bacterium]